MKRTACATVAILLSVPLGQLRAQQTQSQGARSERSAPGADTENAGIDRAAAIGHAVCMAIEGSELWNCAQRAGNPSVGRSDTTGQSGSASALREHAQAAFLASSRLFDAVKMDEDAGSRRESGGSGGNL